MCVGRRYLLGPTPIYCDVRRDTISPAKLKEAIYTFRMSGSDLEQANRHIADGQQRVEQQRARIEELEHDGHDATNSRVLLGLFENTLAQMRRYRERLLRELDG